MKTRLKKILLLCTLILILVIGFFLIRPVFTGKISLTSQETHEYAYTKAICNETNFCQDYEIKCRNNETISLTPITGAVVQHPYDWKDPRDEEKLCG